MLFIALCFAELLLLFFLSRMLTRQLSVWIYRISRNQAFTIHCLALLFLPGVIMHELSHYFTAALLFVHVGEIEFLPKLVDGGVKMGTVAIGKTDPIRRAIIGLSPILLGILILFAAFAFYSQSTYQLFSLETLILLYVVFQIGNTMFSSAKDLEGFLEVGLALVFFTLVFFVFTRIANIALPSFAFPYALEGVLSSLVVVLGVVIALDSLALGIISLSQGGKTWR